MRFRFPGSARIPSKWVRARRKLSGTIASDRCSGGSVIRQLIILDLLLLYEADADAHADSCKAMDCDRGRDFRRITHRNTGKKGSAMFSVRCDSRAGKTNGFPVVLV